MVNFIWYKLSLWYVHFDKVRMDLLFFNLMIYLSKLLSSKLHLTWWLFQFLISDWIKLTYNKKGLKVLKSAVFFKKCRNCKNVLKSAKSAKTQMPQMQVEGGVPNQANMSQFGMSQTNSLGRGGSVTKL